MPKPPPRKNPTQEAVQQAEETIFEKGLPSNVDAERFVLGSVMLNHENYASMVATLQPEDFSLENNRRIYSRMRDVFDRGEIINRVTVANELMKLGQLESVGGLGYLMSLDQGIPELSSIDSYIGIVKKKSLLRQIIFDAQRRIDQALAEAEPKDIITAGMESMRGMQFSNDGPTPGRSPEQIIEEFPGGISAFLDPTRRPKGLPTGFLKFDEYTNGLHAGELTVLGARPAMGKSAWLANVLSYLCLNPKQRRRCSLFSLEMPGESILTRIMCSEARVDQHKFRGGYLNADERKRLQYALDDIINSGLKIYDKYGITMAELEECLRRDVKDSGCAVAGIDYLQLIGIKDKSENRNLEISKITRRLKLICGPTECNIPLIVLSQLSRAGDKRAGGYSRPILSDLRDSGCLHGDSLVTMAGDGRRLSMRSLCGNQGFNVWARSANQTISSVCTAAFSTGIKSMYQMTTVGGRKITATANHHFLSKRGWIRLDEFGAEEIACYSDLPEPSCTTDMSDSENFLLGHLLGNGCILPKHSAQYTTRHMDLAKEVKREAELFFGSGIAPHIEFDNPRKQGGWYQLFFKSTRKHTHGVRSVVSEWAESHGIFGARSRVKRIPESVYGQSRQAIAKFLSGLWETDGTISISKAGKIVISYSSSSPELSAGVQYLLSRMGIISSLSPAIKGNSIVSILGGRVEQLRMCAALSFRGTHYNRNLTAAIAALSRLNGSSSTTKQSDHGIIWDPIRSIEYVGRHEAFDLTVPGPSNMEVNGFVAHNSIEQDADNVLFLHREEIYKKDREDLRGLAEIEIAKQRNGPITIIPLRFIGQFLRFENRAEDLGAPEEMPGNYIS